LILLLVIFGTVFPTLILVLIVWIACVLAATDVPQDTLGRGAGQKQATWLGRLRIWLTATPKRLDYRRDKKGRFRRVRRG
jgi:hypothetical protein